jgi:hypothetical protein
MKDAFGTFQTKNASTKKNQCGTAIALNECETINDKNSS